MEEENEKIAKPGVDDQKLEENTKTTETIKIDNTTKGQLISKCPFVVFKSPKKTTKLFEGFLP